MDGWLSHLWVVAAMNAGYFEDWDASLSEHGLLRLAVNPGVTLLRSRRPTGPTGPRSDLQKAASGSRRLSDLLEQVSKPEQSRIVGRAL
jgi:hypothetical protein